MPKWHLVSPLCWDGHWLGLAGFWITWWWYPIRIFSILLALCAEKHTFHWSYLYWGPSKQSLNIPFDSPKQAVNLVCEIWCVIGADSRFVPNQWETALLCDDVSHWLLANLESSLCYHSYNMINSFKTYLDSKVHGANMGPTWVLLAPDGPHIGPMNLAIRVNHC